MPWPEEKLDLLVHMMLGGAWTDITSTGDVYGHDRAEISIKRGRSSEAGTLEPSRCTMQINNRDGRYTPKNPRSPYFGTFGRNTPIRVWARGQQTYCWIPGYGARARTSSKAGLDLAGDLDVRVECSLDQLPALVTTSGRHYPQELIGRYNATGTPGNRSWRILIDDVGQPLLGWSTTGDDYLELYSPLPLPFVSGQRFALRVTLDVDNGNGGHAVTFYTAPTLAGPWSPLGDPLTGSGTTSVHSPGDASLEIGDVNTSGWEPGRGRYYAAELRDGIDGPLLASPDFTVQEHDTAEFTDTQGNLWQTRNGAQLTHFYRRFVGEVSEFPTQWATGGKDVWTDLEAAGILRRLRQGVAPLQSTLRRRIPSGGLEDVVPLSYWPMEDGTDATQAASPLEGVAPLTTSGLNWAADDSLFGSDALPTTGSKSSIRGLRGPGPVEGGWTVDMSYRLDELPSTPAQMLRVWAGGAQVVRTDVRVSTAGIRVTGYDSEGASLADFTYSDPNALDAFVGGWNRLQVASAVSGGTTYLVAHWRNVITGTRWFAAASYTGGPGVIHSVSADWGDGLSGMAVGHVGIWGVGSTVADDSPLDIQPAVTYFDDADDAFEGELVWSRIRRLADEENLLLLNTGFFYDSQPVGPQRVATVLENVQDCADVDGGMLIEQRESLGLAYLGRDLFYNPTPGLTLPYSAVQHPFEPVDDDKTLRNDRTVSRNGGSSARAVLEEGSLSVLPPPAGAGVYDDQVTLNAASDEQLPDLAHWLLHLGTVDEARYPTVTVDLRRNSELIEDVLSLDIGSTLRITDLPDWLPPGQVDLRVEGWTETLNAFEWRITFNCSPGTPWVVGGLVDDYDLVEDFEDTTYTVTLTDGGDLPWVRDSTQAHDGAWSLKSGAILDNQTSDAVLQLPTDARRVTFWYMTSSEDSGAGFEGDRLTVLVDGVQQLRAQGETAWTEHTLTVTGASTVTFRYTKDNSAGAGADAAWIDDLTVAVVGDAGTDRPNRVDTDGSTLTADVGAADTVLQVGSAVGPTWTEGPDELPLDVRVGGEVARVTSIGPAAADTFTRTVAGGWGTSSSGEPWVLTGGAASEFAVNGTAGTIAPVATPSNLRFGEIVQVAGTVEQLVAITVDSVPAAGEYLPGLFAHAGAVDSATVFYWLNLVLTPSGTALLEVRDTVTAVGGREGPFYGWAAGDRLWLRMLVEGTRVRGRTWSEFEPEPTVWHIDRTLPSLPDGTFGVTVASTDGAATSPTFTVDDYQADTRIQRFTVQRSINGITKTHLTGADIRLAQPMIVAL